MPLLFIALLTSMNVLYYDSSYNIPVFNSTIFFCYILFVSVLLHLFLDLKVFNCVLNGIAIGVILLSLIYYWGYGVYVINEYERLFFFGYNPNELGLLLCIALDVIVYNWIIRDEFSIGKFRVVLMMFFFPLFEMLFATASRTALIVLCLSYVIIVLTFPCNKFLKFLIFVLGGILFITTGVVIMESDSLMVRRFIETLEDGNTSGRTDIWMSLLPYFFENPFFGVGEIGYVEISLRALSRCWQNNDVVRGYSPHNEIITVLLYTGIIGGIYMLLFWSKIFKIGLKNYFIFKNALYLLLLVPIFICIFTAQVLDVKIIWIMYALVIFNFGGNDR
jgi:O-antigen ligase